jgi:hypothetical protein
LPDGVSRLWISIENKNMNFRGIHTATCVHSNW